MTKRPTKPESTEPHSNGVALWAGLTALFTNLTAVGLVRLFKGGTASHLAAAMVTAGVVALSVYARQRWSDAKDARIIAAYEQIHKGAKSADD